MPIQKKYNRPYPEVAIHERIYGQELEKAVAKEGKAIDFDALDKKVRKKVRKLMNMREALKGAFGTKVQKAHK